MSSFLKEKWENLTASLQMSTQEKWWDILCSRYSEPCRKFHTFFHLEHMFKLMDSNSDDIHDKTSMSYAIFFHDIVYDAKSQDNEEESVKVFREFAGDSGIVENEELVTKVVDLIMSSKGCTEEHMSEGLFGKDDVHYFQDFDINYLSAKNSDYLKYASMIEEEYSFIPKTKYCFMRLKVLEHFLQIPNIYATKMFRDKYEEQARKNIKDEIQSLNKSAS
ncbi:uncharacterized protein [Parasteatoda tepidariorum]|uniref:uncharacterized protein n=1 Tax=Parasteatoda tepidariorum TaxID=114398 RepID=UPI00077FBA8F|nr:uncharacterized protein LOC107445489 [Parasteatoda tepidariorum]XP_015915377.1 uncharacterized protein LOC107445489 [Parasteatoda tepidariorum]